MMLTRRNFIGAAAAMPFASAPSFAGAPCVFEQEGVAINGIDPVSYFADARPIAGLDRYRLRWRTAIWQFASLSTMDAFERNPHRYAPRYGGFCAVTMAQGGVSETVPEAWAIHEGQLYLAVTPSAMEAWRHDPGTYIASADSYWSISMCR